MMRVYRYCLIACISVLISSCTKRTINADILITNGTVYNGNDTIPHSESIAIKDDKIIFVGDETSVSISATKTIDANELIVSPGFIDPHTHADRDLKNAKVSHNKPFLFQGVTTVIVGNDGNSYYPLEKYKKLYTEQGIGTNVVMLAGHGTIRKQVMGRSGKFASDEDIVNMQALMQQEMDAGAFGMSTGLFYSPGSYSNTHEVVELAKIVSKNNGIYDTHLRDESTYGIGLIASINEAIEIGRKAKLPIHLSHIKCLGVDVWRQSDSIIKIVEAAQKEGIEVTGNQYPYIASATGLKSATVPRWAESGGKDSLFIRYQNPKLKSKILEETKRNITRRGGPDKLLIVKANDISLVGKNLLEISELLSLSPELTVFKIIKEGSIKVASFNMNPKDIANFMKQPWVVTGSDGGSGHPRKYGTFPKKYRKYVQQEHLISLARFINNSSSKTAQIFRIPNRGQIKEGYSADIIIFDPEQFIDTADYEHAFELAKGLKYNIINGKFAIKESQYTGLLNGEVLQKN